MNDVPALLTAASALTPAGATAEQTASSIRAGLRRLRAHPFYTALARRPEREDEAPLAVAPVPGVDPEMPGKERLFALLLPVLTRLVESAKLLRTHVRSCALLLALPEVDAATAGWGLDDTFVAELLGRLGLSLPVARANRSGQAGMLASLRDAAELLQAGGASRCIVAGVDSFLDPSRLAVLDEGYRLKSPRGVDGFAPGEGASALLLETPHEARKRGATPLAALQAASTADELRPLAGEDPSSGRGLTSALRGVLQDGAPRLLACDLNGESYRSFEWGLVLARLGQHLQNVEKLVLPAATTGDIGAATGGVLVGSVLEAFRRGYAPSNEAIVWASSQGGLRAAARLSRV